MMKKIKDILLYSVMAVALTNTVGCSNSFFDRYPSDSMQMETYMKNESEVQTILLDVYYYLQTVSQNVVYVNSLCTDEAYDYKINNATDFINMNESTWDATLGITASIWSDCYKMINRCNNVIEKAGNVSSANKARFEGEACFFRAYAYFTLVRLFGPVPLTTTVIDDYSTLYGYERSGVDEVYKQINADLTTAIANLPDSYEASTSSGRATRLAAYTMQAEVDMTRNDFVSAKKSLQQVINYANANIGKLGLQASIADIYGSDKPMNKEIILAAQFNNGATVVANDLMKRSIPNVSPGTQPSYTYADGTKSTISCSQGTSCLLMTWELYNLLRSHPNDKRYKEMTYDGIYDTRQSISKQTAEVKVNANGYAYLPTTLKYYDFGNQGLTKCASGCDNIIYRYAGVLLMYAECLNEAGATAEAASWLNLVRTRAGLDNTTAAIKNEMAKAIEDERLLELCFEGHRWYDLVRTGRLNEVMVAHFNHRTPGLSATLQANDNGMVVKDCNSTQGTPLKWKFADGKTAPLFAIPYSQTQLMKGWKQNEGY